MFRNMLAFYGGELLAPPNALSGGRPVVGWQLLLFQYIRSYPPYLDTFASICNPRMHYAVVTWDTLNTAKIVYAMKITFTQIQINLMKLSIFQSIKSFDSCC
jgi:hypothetical protein